jgi:hypothetical protein
MATCPSRTTSLGRTQSIWSSSQASRQVSHSARRGLRFSGGRHLTVEVMNSLSRGEVEVGEHLVEEPPGSPDERSPLLVLGFARSFADEQDVGVRVARAGDGVGPARVERALPAAADAAGEALELSGSLGAVHGHSPLRVRAGRPGRTTTSAR